MCLGILIARKCLNEFPDIDFVICTSRNSNSDCHLCDTWYSAHACLLPSSERTVSSQQSDFQTRQFHAHVCINLSTGRSLKDPHLSVSAWLELRRIFLWDGGCIFWHKQTNKNTFYEAIAWILYGLKEKYLRLITSHADLDLADL